MLDSRDHAHIKFQRVNEDTKKEIDAFLNDKEVIEAGNAIKHAVEEVISYLQIVSNPTENVSPISQTKDANEETPMYLNENRQSNSALSINSEYISKTNIIDDKMPILEDDISKTNIIDDKVPILEDDVIVINDDEINQSYIIDEPVPCLIM